MLFGGRARLAVILCSVLCSVVVGLGQTAIPGARTAPTLPLLFEPNVGQVSGNYKFFSQAADYTAFFSDRDLAFVFRDPRASRTAVEDTPGNASLLRMSFVGAVRIARVEPLDPQESKANYFIGNRADLWHTNIAQFGRLEYKNVYPNVDLVFYGNQHQ